MNNSLPAVIHEESAERSKTDERFRDNLPLLRRARAGDEKATEELIRNNGGLVNHIAVRFLGRGTDYEDLVQIGSIGLLKAIRTFDESRACAFSTYAVPLIFGEIRRFLRDDGPIKVSRVQKRLSAILAAEREKCIDDDSLTLENTLCDEEENEKNFYRIAISAALDKLPDIKKKIILLRYFRDFSQEETARVLGLTQVKISREEKKILAFLRQELS